MNKLIAFTALISVVSMTGCVAVNEKNVSPEAPTRLYPEADALKGAAPISLFEEKNTAGHYVRDIQTDTAINPGSSAGPLIILAGTWININTAQIAQSQRIGFTAPSVQVKEFINTVLRGEDAPAK